jgi:hypothetical protein
VTRLARHPNVRINCAGLQVPDNLASTRYCDIVFMVLQYICAGVSMAMWLKLAISFALIEQHTLYQQKCYFDSQRR